jgi:hypothetical protein
MLIQEPPSGVVAVVAWILILQSRRTFHFLPIEAWLETLNRVEERFPRRVEVVARFRRQWLKAYLSGNYPITNKIDLAKFCAW